MRGIKGRDFNVSPEAGKILRNAYLLLAGTMVPTVLGVFLGMLFPVFSYLPIWVAFVIDLAASFYAIFAIHRHKNSMTGIYWLGFLTLITGYFISPVFELYTEIAQGPQMIIISLAGTAGLFGVLSAIGRSSRYNLSGPSFGLFLLMGLVWMIILSVINILFIQLSLLSLLITFGVMGICSLLIMYETNRVVRGGETNYVVVALGFYLSLVNIFLSLLQILLPFDVTRD